MNCGPIHKLPIPDAAEWRAIQEVASWTEESPHTLSKSLGYIGTPYTITRVPQQPPTTKDPLYIIEFPYHTDDQIRQFMEQWKNQKYIERELSI